MHKIIRHWFTNLAGIGAVVSFCVENWLSGILGPEWQKMSWGWFAIVLTAIWLGAQIRQFENGDHWLQGWRAHKQRFASVPELRKQSVENGYAYFADIAFLRDAKNATVTVETFRAEVRGWGARWAWMRIRLETPIERADRNKGDVDSVIMIEIKNRPMAETKNPTEQRGHWRLKVRLTVTAAGREPHINERIFLWKEGGVILPMPLDVPTEEEGDSSDFSERRCILSAIE